MQGFNAGHCFFVRDQELRAACKAGAGTPCGTRCPNRDSVRHHVSRSGFGGTYAILCRNSMPGPGASLGMLASMRDSMRDPASSYGLWDSVRTARQDPGPNPGPRALKGVSAAPRISIGIRMHMRHGMPDPGTRTGVSEFHAGWTCLKPPSTVCEAPCIWTL